MEVISESVVKDGKEFTVHKTDDRPQLIVSHWIYWITEGQEIHAIQHTHTHRGSKHEQAYKRDTKASQEWVALDYGWIEEPSFIAIVNNEKDLQYSLFVSYDSEQEKNLIVLPGACQLFYPCAPERLFIRASMPASKYTIHVFPK